MTCSARPTQRAFARFIASATLLTGLGAIVMSPATHAQETPSWAAPLTLDSVEPPTDDASVPDPPPDPVPIGGGFGLLALAGGTYAARKLMRSASDEQL